MPAHLPVRRRALLAVPAVAAAASVPAFVQQTADAGTTKLPDRPRTLVSPVFAGPVAGAYTYLRTVQDAYESGDALRLLQSYNNESGLMTTAFVYDNALAALAYLAHPTADNVRRARLIGDALLFIQTADDTPDGRIRQAYAAGPMQFYGGGTVYTGLRRDDGKAAVMAPFGFTGSAVGDVAWAALALAQLFRATRVRRYLDGAVKAAGWIAARRSAYAFGGYHGGVQADGVTPQKWCSSEHNIDAYALFTLLGKLTGDRVWQGRATVAGDFVRKMWNAKDRFYWTGTLGAFTGDDPNLINKVVVPEDVQTWASLALRDQRSRIANDWVVRALSTTDTGGTGSQVPAGVTVSGVTFSDRSKVITTTVPNGDTPNHRNAVWLEGNGHLALALLDRNGYGDRSRAESLLGCAVTAQQKLGAGQTVGRTADPNGGRLSDPAAGGSFTGTKLPAGGGIVAASSAFDTGFGFGYFQRQHVGATAWFLMAALRFNPYT